MSVKQLVKIGGGNSDCLNTIRLLAAIEVLMGHTAAHLELAKVPVFGEFIHFFSGVPIFFTMSGFLIWSSIGRSHSYPEYLKKRFWRIYPELWVAILVELIVLLLLYHEPINWVHFGAFAFTQSTIFQFWTPDCLRAYGCGCPNGSLWTICVLIQFYIFAYFIYKLLHNRKIYAWVIVFVASVLASLCTPLIDSQVPEVVSKLYHQTLSPYLWMFIFPSFVAEKKDKLIPLFTKYWWVFVGAVLMIKYTSLHAYDLQASYSVIHTLILFCAVTGFAYRFPILNIKTDISYGVYIYHMTVVNALIALGFMGYGWEYIVVIIITCVLSYLSTKYVGEFSKRMKQNAISK